MPSICAAADIGASSGRVIVGQQIDGRLSLTEIHRLETPQFVDQATGHQCWDVDAIEAGVRTGLAKAEQSAPVASIGVDTWAIDYVLLDAELKRIGPAVAYRDHRTDEEMERMFARVPAADIYRRTGIQFLPFNTLYQLAACAREHPDWLERARHFLMMPDYLHFRLSGVLSNEYTNATTTQFYSAAADRWDRDLLTAAGASTLPMTRPVEAGTILGTMPSRIEGRAPIWVIAPATHDTGSAVAATPLESDDEAYISSGTWSLMGIESRTPFVGDDARVMNFSNEGGVGRRYRVLKNIMGLWLIQRVRKELGTLDHAGLVAAAQRARPWQSLINPQDVRFLNPESMVAAIRGACAETGQPIPEDAGALARCIFESLALSYRQVREELEALRGRALSLIHIVGGGCQNAFLNQLTADASGLPVSAGPVETAALGNLCVQMIALGELASLDEARAAVRRSFPPDRFAPRNAVPNEAWSRYRSMVEHKAEKERSS